MRDNDTWSNSCLTEDNDPALSESVYVDESTGVTEGSIRLNEDSIVRYTI